MATQRPRGGWRGCGPWPGCLTGTGKPFCRRQCYAGELKGNPQLLLLGDRAFVPNLVTERGRSGVSVLRDSTVVRPTGIRCLQHRSREAGGAGRPADSPDKPVPNSLSLVRSWRGEAPCTPTSLLSPNCRDREGMSMFPKLSRQFTCAPKHLASARPAGAAAMVPSVPLQPATPSNLKIVSE